MHLHEMASTNDKEDDGVDITRRKANRDLLNLFALAVLASSSDVGKGANSLDLVISGENRTMLIPASFNKDPEEMMMLAEEDLNMIGTGRAKKRRYLHKHDGAQVEYISKPIPPNEKNENCSPFLPRVFWNCGFPCKKESWISLVLGNSGRLSWCLNLPHGKYCWRGPARLNDLSGFPFGTLPAKWLPNKIRSLLKHCKPEVKWVLSASGIGFQVPPEDIYIASVVPSSVKALKKQIDFVCIRSEHILDGSFVKKCPTIGVDRALCLRASFALGAPILVFDFGTAMTVSACDKNRAYVGGAILPGAKLQLNSLSSGTSELPDLILPKMAPDLFGITTENAIQSGVVNGLSATARFFMRSWLAKWPESQIIATGGDSSLMLNTIAQQWKEQESVALPIIHRCNYLVHIGIALHMHDIGVV